MNRMIEVSLLAWCPESIEEKTQILCIKRCPRAEALCVVPALDALLEHGPVCTSEPGFSWTEDPGMCIGLTVWRGVLEIEEDGKVHFAGKWSVPTIHDLYHLAGLKIERIS